MMPAYSPQARGHSERNFGTWQRRLPPELRLRGIRTIEAADQFLREHSMAEFNSTLKPPIIKRFSSVQLFPLQRYRVREPTLAATFV
jgi:hypothetical protein